MTESTIQRELAQLEKQRAEIIDIESKFLDLIKKYDTRGRKKNYSQKLSNLLAQRLANDLRPTFPGILPDSDGRGQESRALGRDGPVKLDVNFSNSQYGLALGISIKTVNFRDLTTRRYTKNIKRNDKEFRAEATDYHRRQPFAIMIGLVFLPEDARGDAKAGGSSFLHALRTFSHRSGRTSPEGHEDRFEKIWVASYALDAARFGEVSFFDSDRFESDPNCDPVSYRQVLDAICDIFEARNKVKLRRRP